MYSGFDDYQGIRGNEFYEDNLRDISNAPFVHKTFSRRPSLRSKHPLSIEQEAISRRWREFKDGTSECPWNEQQYNADLFEKIEDGWDHEHCCICRFTIDSGYTYWENQCEDIVCDACYNHYGLHLAGKAMPKFGDVFKETPLRTVVWDLFLIFIVFGLIYLIAFMMID